MEANAIAAQTNDCRKVKRKLRRISLYIDVVEHYRDFFATRVNDLRTCGGSVRPRYMIGPSEMEAFRIPRVFT